MAKPIRTLELQYLMIQFFISKQSMIVWVSVVLNRAVVDSD